MKTNTFYMNQIVAQIGLLLINLCVVPTFASPRSQESKIKDSIVVEKGGQDSGGGNGAVAEFYGMARHFARFVDRSAPPWSRNVLPKGVSGYIANMKVESVPGPLFLKGVKVDAINYPTKTLVNFDESAWSQRPLFRKYQIVIHEILGLQRDLHYKSDSDYSISEDLQKESFESYIKAFPAANQKQPARRQSGKAESIYENSDGSTTFSNPYVEVGGSRLRIAIRQIRSAKPCNGKKMVSQQEIFSSSMEGLCRAFGKQELVDAQEKRETFDFSYYLINPGAYKFAVLNEKGNLKKKIEVSSGDCPSVELEADYIKELTCR